MTADFESTEVAVVLITRDEKILAVYNHKWRSFTLPMTKRLKWEDPDRASVVREEDWEDAAARAAAEWLQRILIGELEHLLDVEDYLQGDEDGRWQRYHFKVYRVVVGDSEKLPEGAIVTWLTADQFADPNYRPISTTARHIISRLLTDPLEAYG